MKKPILITALSAAALVELTDCEGFTLRDATAGMEAVCTESHVLASGAMCENIRSVGPTSAAAPSTVEAASEAVREADVDDAAVAEAREVSNARSGRCTSSSSPTNAAPSRSAAPPAASLPHPRLPARRARSARDEERGASAREAGPGPHDRISVQTRVRVYADESIRYLRKYRYKSDGWELLHGNVGAAVENINGIIRDGGTEDLKNTARRRARGRTAAGIFTVLALVSANRRLTLTRLEDRERFKKAPGRSSSATATRTAA